MIPDVLAQVAASLYEIVAWLLATGIALSSYVLVLAGRQPRARLAVGLVAGLAVAVIHALQQGQWMVGGVPAFVGLAAALCPMADAAISRRSEFAADRFAADHGLALELAAALRAMNDDQRAADGWSRRLLASHPTPDRRISAILTTTVHRHA